MADQQGVPDGWAVVDDSAPARKPASMSAAVPGTAIGADNPNILAGAIGPKSRQFLDTPLANTGVEGVDKLTTPANLGITAATLALGAERAAALPAKNILLKAKAAMTAVAETAAPAIKYEVAKSALEAMHVPSSLATVIAMGVSGYKSKGAPEATAKAPVSAAESVPRGTMPAEPVVAASAPTAAEPAAAAPAASAPQSAPAPAASGSGPSPDLKSLMASGMKPTEAARALKLLRQGATPADVEQRVLSARPSEASVAPAVPDRSPIQQQVGIKPGQPASNAQITNGLSIAARRAKVTLSDAELDLLKPLVKQGMTPEEAVRNLPALKLQQMPGVLTPDQMNAEIAARVGNRSPSRK